MTARKHGTATGEAARELIGLLPERSFGVGSVAVLVKFVYWLAVLAISLALVVGLILFFEARDASEVEDSDREGSITWLA